jgi:hypothetical protein
MNTALLRSLLALWLKSDIAGMDSETGTLPSIENTGIIKDPPEILYLENMEIASLRERRGKR